MTDMILESIVTTYYELVRAGRRTINQVPSHLRPQVQAKLDENKPIE